MRHLNHSLRFSAAPAWSLAGLLLLSSCGGGGGGQPEPDPQEPPVAQCQTIAVPNEGWSHVPEGSAINYAHNPPASGPHYASWGRYIEHTTPLARGHYVHNIEHGGVVFLYHPDAPPASVQALRQVFQSLPNDPACSHPRAVMTADPLLAQPTTYVVAANVMLQAGCLDPAAIRSFVEQHRNKAPEQSCAQGIR
jgi:hypothetical protein